MRQEELLTLVRNLRTAVPEIQGVMLASQDGLPIVHDFPLDLRGVEDPP